MKIYKRKIEIKTSSRVEFIDITKRVLDIVKDSKISEGICYIFVPHTTAAVTINENADRDVIRDIISTLNNLIPQEGNFRHMEGNSDAHIKSSLIGISVEVSVAGGILELGTWQGIFFCEFDGPRNREIWIKVLGE
ncbi:MAG: secondary thiamine-phosphate synthase enzyme YjbQ [Elusimicrobiota bacterium]|nr:secondary thiamine-phosphate synthase enzyme YjbQ [Endomicrobiia bacterium]MDW8165749.1 secondary thiamine-phosphate synthase enzyme YjbQ [Elusimicrobiota bacterium]